MTDTGRLPFEWPTWLLILVIYGGWLALTWWTTRLAWWIVLPAGAWLAAWQQSLQHELLHNHPTRSRRVNTVIGFPPLSLWLPYLRYRDLHLSHHRDQLLTDPVEDPESYYLTDAIWQRRGPVRRAMTRLLNSFAGRILLGPLAIMFRFLAGEARQLVAGSRRLRRIWSVHALGVIVVLFWVDVVCGIPFWRYILCFVYPGVALTAIRSFAEHRAAADPAHRTAIVEQAPILGLLFLFNNLHVVHHDLPSLPWYAIPGLYRRNRAAYQRRNQGLVYRGYQDVIRRYLVREHHPPVIPVACLPSPARTGTGPVP